MKFLLKTQIAALYFSFIWIVYLNGLVFFNHPERLFRYINVLVYIFAVVIGILYFYLARRLLKRSWTAIFLVLLPYIVVYKPILVFIQSYFSKGFYLEIRFFDLSTGGLNLIITIIALMLNNILPQKNK